MKNKRKGNFKRIIYSAIIIYVAFILLKQQASLFECRKQSAYYLNEVKKNMKVSQELQKKKEVYNSDFFVEKMAREKLGMVYSGEKIFKDISR